MHNMQQYIKYAIYAKNIQTCAIYAKNIQICKISMYVSIHCEAKSAALNRIHHLLGMQEGTSSGICRRVRAGRQRADGAAPKRQGTKVATNRPFKFGSAPASEWQRGGPGRPSRLSHPLPALWIGPGHRHRLASPFNCLRGHASGSSKGPTASGTAGFRPTCPADRDWPVH